MHGTTTTLNNSTAAAKGATVLNSIILLGTGPSGKHPRSRVHDQPNVHRLKCTCHHTHQEHRHAGEMGACISCDCSVFYSSFSCSCGQLWANHSTVFETATERAASGRPLQEAWGGVDSTSAACGAVTNFSSLLPGVDRCDGSGAEQHVELQSPHLKASLSNVTIKIGDRVVARKNDAGYLRFVGEVGFSEGTWCGVELDQPTGKNDGQVQGKRYFKCAARHGCFVKLDQLQTYTAWRTSRYACQSG